MSETPVASTCFAQTNWTECFWSLGRLDGERGGAAGRGGSSHGLISITRGAPCYSTTWAGCVYRGGAIKMLREPFSTNEIVVQTHWALTDRMECKC